MKNKKCALGLVAMLAAVAGLTACDQVTSSNSGSIFTYTDANGVRTSYTAEDLLTNYRKSGSSLSSEFDKVYEVLVRHYYDNLTPSTTLDELKAKATKDVMTDKENAASSAKTNSTTYEAELEKTMTSNGVKNADELYQYHLYQEEKTKFEDDIYQTFGQTDSKLSGLDIIKNGAYSDGTKIFQSDASTWGISNDGWMLQQMPYHVRHILVKFASGKTGEFTQDKIGESTDTTGGETTKLAQTIMDLAGADYVNSGASDRSAGSSTIKATSARSTFGAIAQLRSDDTTSAAAYGDPEFFTKTTEFNNEFKLGTYTYESLYNQRESEKGYGSSNVYRITPGLTENATSTSDIDANQTVNTPNGSSDLYNYFKNFEYNVTATSTTKGIGQIPFGAAVALLDYRGVTKDSGGNVVNEGNEAFYPRNVLFNKYFNKHNVCVITPNAIWSNQNSTNVQTQIAAAGVRDDISPASNEIANQNFVGTPVSEYYSLPGFQKNTQKILPGFAHNVLTDESGNVVLAVRTSTSGYQAMHLMIVQRSALSQYGLTTDASGNVVEATSDLTSNGIPTLSEYYSTVNPGDSTYPVDSSGKAVTTYVNFNKQTTQAYSDRSKKITSDIKSYNSSLSTYLFQKLYEGGNITFTDSKLEDEMMTYSRTKRQSDKDTAFTSWKTAWKTYAEVLSAQEEARTRGLSTGLGSLLSETVAVQFTSSTLRSTYTNLWSKGGACYYGTK
jgi:hypothetical protein